MTKKQLTRDGYEKLKNELKQLKTVKRKEMAERLKHAISFGDLSENAAYHEAKEAQAFLEGRIAELEDMLGNTEVAGKSISGKIALCSEVILEINEDKQSFEIVGANEADPLEGKISAESPLGKALIGRRVGDKVTLRVPSGMVEYRIVEIK
ncbi:MAG: transcription elongation factor GreA [bacterium]